MPFITEELWQVTAPSGRDTILALTEWPCEQPYFMDAHEEIGWLIELVTSVRSVRAEVNVPVGSLIQLELCNPSDVTRGEQRAGVIRSIGSPRFRAR